MIIDQTFLKPHWRTVLWWAEREQCRRCKHMSIRPTRPRNGGRSAGSEVGGGWVCAMVPGGPGGAGTSCIDARERGCGPDATRFEARA